MVDELETLKKDRTNSLLRIDELERQVHVAAKADTTQRPKKNKANKKKKGKYDTSGDHLVVRIDGFQRKEEELTAVLKQKEDQRYQATQQVIALEEKLSSSQRYIENLQHRYQEMVDSNKQMEGEIKQLHEIAPEDIPEDVDVRVLVSQLRARVSTLERENQQVKEHTKQQSKHIQIMKQHEEGIEVGMYV